MAIADHRFRSLPVTAGTSARARIDLLMSIDNVLTASPAGQAIPSFAPEECPFDTVIVDVTHRCNMACRNCYIPNRTIPDLDAAWLSSILARLKRGRFVRLVGAEPTMRRDLIDLIRDIRRNHHHPVLVTNGLKLANLEFVRELRRARLPIVYLSMNGGLDDALYRELDDMACAAPKLQALENVCNENFYVTVGMILVRGINEDAPRAMLEHLSSRPQVKEMHFRSVGALGRYMDRAPFSLTELLEIIARSADIDPAEIELRHESPNAVEFDHRGGLRIHLTQWPDLGSTVRGRLTPEGRIEPFFEHVMANEGGY